MFAQTQKGGICLDKFLFRYSHYKVLDAVKDQSWEGAPFPFRQCLFIFQDTFLLVESRLLSESLLHLKFEKEGRVLGAASVTVQNYCWPRGGNLEIETSGSLPPECLYEFIRFYQRLSIYLSQKREVLNTSPREIIKEDLGREVEPTKKKERELDERIICLGDLPATSVFRYVKPYIATPRHQQNPCDYAYWVRGHTRLCKSGTRTWVRPHMRNTSYPEKDHIYTL